MTVQVKYDLYLGKSFCARFFHWWIQNYRHFFKLSCYFGQHKLWYHSVRGQIILSLYQEDQKFLANYL